MKFDCIFILLFVLTSGCKSSLKTKADEKLDFANDKNFAFDLKKLESDLESISDHRLPPKDHFNFANEYFNSSGGLDNGTINSLINGNSQANGLSFINNDFCTQILNKAILQKLRTTDTKKKKTIKSKAIKEYFECVYGFPNTLCDFLDQGNSEINNLPKNLENYLETSFKRFVKDYSKQFPTLGEKPIRIHITDSSFKDSENKNQLFFTKDSTYRIITKAEKRETRISPLIVKGVFLLHFKEYLELYVRLKLNHWQVDNFQINPENKLDSDKVVTSFYLKLANNFKFAIFHEIGHMHLKNMNQQELTNLELICDCLASSVFKKESKKIFFGLYKNVLLNTNENCNIWRFEDYELIKHRSDKVLKFNEAPKLFNEICKDSIDIIN